MALQSQYARGSILPRSSESYHRARRVEQRRLIGYLLLVLLIGALIVYGYRSRGPRPVSADAGERSLKTLAQGVPATAAPATSTSPTITPARSPSALPVAAREPADARSDTRADTRSSPSTTVGPTPTNATKGLTFPPPETVGSAQGVKDPLLAPPGSPQPPAPVIAQPSGQPGSQPPNQPGASPMPIATLDTGSLPAEISSIVSAADQSIAAQKPLEARTLLNKALLDPRTPSAARSTLRARLSDLNQTLVFSPAIFAGDPLSESYSVVSGDSLVKIARTKQLVTESSLIARVNRLPNANSLRVGQKLKLVRGPFHAVVHKSAFRADVYAGPTPAISSMTTEGVADGAEAGWTYIRSFPVGLGEKGVTPIASFTVKDNSKLVNPFWVNPRTGEKFDADDPKNPIGERWIGLEGLDVKSKGYTGYGIHGTVVPESIGREMSMGCVRMGSEDVEAMYELLMPRVSVVKIVP